MGPYWLLLLQGFLEDRDLQRPSVRKAFVLSPPLTKALLAVAQPLWSEMERRNICFRRGKMLKMRRQKEKESLLHFPPSAPVGGWLRSPQLRVCRGGRSHVAGGRGAAINTSESCCGETAGSEDKADDRHSKAGDGNKSDSLCSQAREAEE